MRLRIWVALVGSRYGNEIKEFALTLHFYSPKAYKFVRKSLHLPHPATLGSWCVKIHCEPGFLEKSLNYIEEKVAEGQQDYIILIDEMSIRKQIQWDRRTNTFASRVNYGGIQAENLDSEATNALMLMASGLQKPWFVPIAYFLTHRVNGDILKQLIMEAINKLTEKEAEVHAIVFDGASENLAMATKLGCNVKELDGSFDHPTKPAKKYKSYWTSAICWNWQKMHLQIWKFLTLPLEKKFLSSLSRLSIKLNKRMFFIWEISWKQKIFNGKIIKWKLVLQHRL